MPKPNCLALAQMPYPETLALNPTTLALPKTLTYGPNLNTQTLALTPLTLGP